MRLALAMLVAAFALHGVGAIAAAKPKPAKHGATKQSAPKQSAPKQSSPKQNANRPPKKTQARKRG